MSETRPSETQQEANERMEEALGQALKWFVGDHSEVVIHRYAVDASDRPMERRNASVVGEEAKASSS
ncbi:hypothetical protein [Jiella mangrovi]|uniref:Uncharacterized protein n=1 Tax=Jiella mangrovi TaxID=2821407 RepID=A0ABS4BJL1_9HYPH|nr:hypothetical protein [Jiella mangrovi]MBP0616948.1 hypothetical protein [Jiella mangrovi]